MVDEIRVLYVDDDKLAREMRGDVLSEYDELSVVTETNPVAAMDVLDRGDVDCVLSDFDMPEQDGLAFLETVRERDPSLPFILFTSAESTDLAVAALEAGATDFVPKSLCSISYRLLANRIQQAVEYHEACRRLERELS